MPRILLRKQFLSVGWQQQKVHNMAAQGAKAERVIMVALDDSEHSHRAIEFYFTDLCRQGDQVILIHCYSPPHPPTHGLKFAAADHEFWDDWREKVHKELTSVRGMLFSFEEKCEARKVKSKTLVRSGKSGEEIVQAASENNVTLIVIGSRGQNRIRRTLLGSVSDYVIHHTNIPVTVIPPRS